MTNFSLDAHSVLPPRIGPSQDWQVAAPYYSRSKGRWLQNKSSLDTAPLLYPATVVEVSEDRTSAVLRYHDEPPNASRRVHAEHIIFPATVAPRAQRCNRFEEFLRLEPMQKVQKLALSQSLSTEDGLATPPLPEPSTERTVTSKAAPHSIRRFEMQGKNGMKFWHISREGRHTTTHYGAVNAKPRSSHRAHDDPEAAIKFFDDMITSKVAKGYSEPDNFQGDAPDVFIAKWPQKCSCGCKTNISCGDEIVKHVCTQSFPTASLFDEHVPSPVSSRSRWAIRKHLEEPRNYR